jgi:alkaline phosphatase
MRHFFSVFLLWFTLPLLSEPASVIFIHPDGTGLGHWHAARLLEAGPDGKLNWDRLERAAVYRAHQKNWLSTTSHAGATVHAYGKKVHHDSFGMDKDQPLVSASGSGLSIMQEAIARGIPSGIVNSGHIAEPGTAVFLASSETRGDKTGIAEKVLNSGAEVIFCGGEIYLIPEGQTGKHGEEGRRTDGRNLLQEVEADGYTVIYTRDELLALDPGVERVIGIFAAGHTFNAAKEQDLLRDGLPWFDPAAPTLAEMTAKAVEILSRDSDRPFLLVTEEEGTDNFSNNTNAGGAIEALRRADAAIGEALAYQQRNPERKVLVVTAADSDAGHPSVWAPRNLPVDQNLPATTDTGAALDGVEGSGSLPFVSAPDAYGNRHAFAVAWPFSFDMQGSVVAKAHGHGSDRLPADLDNTGIYTLMRSVLFDEPAP